PVPPEVWPPVRDPLPTSGRRPYAAAHHDAIHEGDIRLREFGDARVENVLLAPQDFAEIAFHLRAFIQRPDVAAGAEAAIARAFQQDQADRGVRLEFVERLVDVAKHLQR